LAGNPAGKAGGLRWSGSGLIGIAVGDPINRVNLLYLIDPDPV
jgi:hypothetical protein